ncbi:uncharacterized protein LOC106057854 isoform X2 [Biomphalaria glabrata]|uniref:Uncharacterized protein LOC106057854 isoform X2 n=1 Tax=Biomphalaria glabrata TaxID=6526 RepID=A0A9W3A772_BIOGL|nr:uncharacterized protein LOC106057854 isoform X2 [Biomphalaria glabrata]
MSLQVDWSCLLLFSICIGELSALYPPSSPVNQSGGAPQSLGAGWSPGLNQGVSAIDKQGAETYLQALTNLQNQFKLLMQSSKTETKPAPPQPPKTRPAPLVWPPATPAKPLPIPMSPPVRPPPPPNNVLPPNDNGLDLNMPNMPMAPYQPYQPYTNQYYPQAPPPPPRQQMPMQMAPQRMAPQQHYWPPPGMRPQSRECSGGYVPGQLCCDGIVNPIPPGPQQWACCHKGMYDMATQVCCGDIPVPKPPKNSPPMMCCGSSLYDPMSHLCCDKFPVPNLSRNMKCCRKQTYDPVHQMCCGEGVRARPPGQPHMSCCGKHMFNSLTHVCCDEGNAIPKNPTVSCCGKNQYQPAFQQCCFGDALPKDVMCMAK